MHSIIRAPWLILCLSLCNALFAQTAPPPPSEKPAEQVYKNIQILKGTPANQITPSMQFMSSSLGVRCDHCHVEGAFEKDDKKPKQTARAMMKMVAQLNQSDFKGQKGVTCYSCHRGALRPRRTPAVLDQNAPPRRASATTLAEGAADKTAFNNLIQAAGGSSALEAITSQVATGSMDLGNEVRFPIEILLKRPGMRSMIVHLPNGDSVEVESGESGWSVVPGRPLHVMSRQEVEAAWADANPVFLEQLASKFAEVRVQTDKEIEGKKVTAIRAGNPNQVPVRLYVDQQTGLLLRIVHYVETPLGRNPTQLDYSDYRDVAGTKQPFHWTVSTPQGHYAVQLEKVEVNVPLPDSRFAKPQADNSPGGH